MRYREFSKLVESDTHSPSWDQRSIRSVIDLNILHQDEFFANRMRPNDGLLILGLVGDPKLKELQSDMRWIADKMSSVDPNNLDSRVQHAYGSDDLGTDVQGTFEWWNGKITGLVADINDEWQRYNDNTVLQHEALHRAFTIIAATPKLMSVMPADLKNYWSDGIGNAAFNTYDPANTDGYQFSPEHSMIYSVTSPGDGRAAYYNKGLYDNYSRVKEFFDRLSPVFNDRYIDLTNDEQPIEYLEDQMEFYWTHLYKQCNKAIRDALSQKGLLYSLRPRARPDSIPTAAPRSTTDTTDDARSGRTNTSPNRSPNRSPADTTSPRSIADIAAKLFGNGSNN